MEKVIWWKESVIYQIYPRSFMDSNGDGIGDLKGITSRLDYLLDLGVDVIWISPFFKSPNADMGYDISDYQDIMDEFGCMEDFDDLLKNAHERGLKIVMDLVVNHSSNQHPWFIESRKSKDNPYRDYYIWKEGRNGKEPNNWGSYFSGPAWTYDEKTDMYYLHQFAKDQPDLNWENEDVRKEIYKMMTWWCDKGIDGFRMDVINLISKDQTYPDYPIRKADSYGDTGYYLPNGPRVHEFLKEMNREVLSKYDLITVGETPSVTTKDALEYAGFDTNELNMVFQFEHMGLDSDEGSKWTDKKIYLPKLKEVMSRWQEDLEGKAWNSLYWCNHDQPRIISRFGDDRSEYRQLSGKMLATCLHMMKGTPYIYQGEEIGMTNIEIDNIEDFRDLEIINAYNDLVVDRGIFTKEEMLRYINLRGRDNARTPMQWDDTANAGFTSGIPWLKVNPNYKEINVKEARADRDSIFYHYKKLIELRKKYDIIVYGKYRLLKAQDENLYIYERELGSNKLLVINNFTDKKLEYQHDKGKILISNYKDDLGAAIRPYESKVYLYS